MPGIPIFDGGVAGWFIVGALVMGGAATAVAGWSRVSLGLGSLGLLAVVAAALWVAPALSQDTSDLDAMLKSAQANVDRQQAGLVEWATGLEHRGESQAAEADAVRSASQARPLVGIATLNDPDLRGAGVGPQPSQDEGGVYVAVSLSMPPQTLRALARDANRAGAKVVIRGLVDGSFKATLVRIRQVFDDHSAGGVAIDPQVFKAFAVSAVPTIIAARSSVEPCGNLGCSPQIPPFDKVSGNISLEAALKSLADEGENGRQAARAALARLTG